MNRRAWMETVSKVMQAPRARAPRTSADLSLFSGIGLPAELCSVKKLEGGAVYVTFGVLDCECVCSVVTVSVRSVGPLPYDSVRHQAGTRRESTRNTSTTQHVTQHKHTDVHTGERAGGG